MNAAGPAGLQAGLPVIAAVLYAMAALGVSYQLCKHKAWYSRGTILAMKGGTTLLAALLALYGALGSRLPAHLWLAGGIALCAAADVTLELHFIAGMLNFALGHLCFMIAFLLLQSPGLQNLSVFAALALLMLPAVGKLRSRLDRPFAPYAAYALIIAAMLSLAFEQKPPVFIGALLFVLSDGILFYRLVHKPAGRLSDHLCMLFYYAAQFTLALSTLIR